MAIQKMEAKKRGKMSPRVTKKYGIAAIFQEKMANFGEIVSP
jgi:hypothetical protein